MLSTLLAWLFQVSGWPGRRRSVEARTAAPTELAEDIACRSRQHSKASGSLADLALAALAEYVVVFCLVLLAALLRLDRGRGLLCAASGSAARLDSPRGPPRWCSS